MIFSPMFFTYCSSANLLLSSSLFLSLPSFFSFTLYVQFDLINFHGPNELHREYVDRYRFIYLFVYLFIIQLYLSSFSPHYSICPTHSHLPHSILPPWLSLSMSLSTYPCSWWPFPFFPPLSLPPPLGSLSVCSLFPCFWFDFAHFFILLIRFTYRHRPIQLFPDL